MNRLSFYISTLLAATIAFGTLSSCQRIEDGMEAAHEQYLKITAEVPSFDIQETKASAPLTDSLYAYPFDNALSYPVKPIVYDSYVDGSYLFTIPENAENIIFTTIGSNHPQYTLADSPASSLIEMTVKDSYGIGSDILIGGITDYDASTSERTVALKRAVSKIQISLKASYGNDSLVNISDKLSSASVSIGNIYSTLKVAQDMTWSYDGLDTVSADYTNKTCDTLWKTSYIYTLPSVENETPYLTLSIRDLSLNEWHYRVPLPEAVLTNKAYTVSLALLFDNFSASISIDDIQMKEYIIEDMQEDVAGFDLVTFTPASMHFNNLSEGAKELTVHSRLGEWKALVAQSTLDNFRITHKRTGAALTTAEFAGQDGDILVIEPVNDNSEGTKNINGDIVFNTGTGHQYNARITQTNGKLQTITFHATQIYGLTVDGTNFSIYKKSDGATEWSALVENSSEAYNRQAYLYNCDVKIEGDILNELHLSQSTNISTLAFDNCYSLETLSLEGLHRDASIDFSFLSSLYSLKHFRLYSSYSDISGITSLNFTGNADLEDIYVRYISNIQLINASGCSTLKSIELEDIGVQSVNVSNCTALNTIKINSCENVSVLNLTGSESIKHLTFTNTTSGVTPKDLFDFTKLPLLETLTLKYLKSEEINLTSCSNLREVSLNNMNYLATLNCTDLKKLTKFENAPTAKTLILNGCSAITELAITESTSSTLYLTDLQLNDMTSLSSLSIAGCRSDSFTSFTMNTAVALKSFRLEGTDFTSLTLPSDNILEEVYIYGNFHLNSNSVVLNAQNTLKDLTYRYNGVNTYLTDLSFNLSGYSKLTRAVFRESSLYSLNISGCTELAALDLQNCDFSAEELNNVFNTLPERDENSPGSYRITNNTGASTCDQNIAMTKNWLPTTNEL